MAKSQPVCNRMHIVTSLDKKKGLINNIKGELKGGEWCQFLLFDKIYAKYLKNTVVTWNVDQNGTSPNMIVKFYETNTTQTLDNKLT
jgi:hypothetical protein